MNKKKEKERKKKKGGNRASENYRTILKGFNICVVRASDREENECGAEKIFEAIMSKNFPFW